MDASRWNKGSDVTSKYVYRWCLVRRASTWKCWIFCSFAAEFVLVQCYTNHIYFFFFYRIQSLVLVPLWSASLGHQGGSFPIWKTIKGETDSAHWFCLPSSLQHSISSALAQVETEAICWNPTHTNSDQAVCYNKTCLHPCIMYWLFFF